MNHAEEEWKLEIYIIPCAHFRGFFAYSWLAPLEPLHFLLKSIEDMRPLIFEALYADRSFSVVQRQIIDE